MGSFGSRWHLESTSKPWAVKGGLFDPPAASQCRIVSQISHWTMSSPQGATSRLSLNRTNNLIISVDLYFPVFLAMWDRKSRIPVKIYIYNEVICHSSKVKILALQLQRWIIISHNLTIILNLRPSGSQPVRFSQSVSSPMTSLPTYEVYSPSSNVGSPTLRLRTLTVFFFFFFSRLSFINYWCFCVVG